MSEIKTLANVIQELKKYGNPYQRIVIFVDGDYYFDTTVDGAYVAVGDMSKLKVVSVDDDKATEKWLPILIHCVTEAQN